LSYYAKKDDFLKGKPAKGQILILGSEMEKTNLIKKEPFSFIVYQPDGRRFALSANTAEEMESWMNDIKKSAATNRGGDVARFDMVIKQQDELIRKLQKALRELMGDKDTNRKLKRPNEAFYKEFFFFLALSVKKNMETESEEINIQALYDKASKENIPFYKWYQWLPEQIQAIEINHEDSQKKETQKKLFNLTNSLEASICIGCNEALDDGTPTMVSNGKSWHVACFKCQLCTQLFPDGVYMTFDTAPGKKFCPSCHRQLDEMIKKKLVTPDLELNNHPFKGKRKSQVTV